ncbi:cysteine methyltransferase [Tumebacillus algifaecis]|uniref:Methylated-DNA--protein-cysteine methyltransferase n=1 Tax=Tumebacillus algifaecis TaxID=1214604 RepID=A0A223D2S4_9BACL|nr:methylated-DNA--[protein]-cysteine S-methyltransferase [Tumebacillus algifaecis]ASS75958.1 cysteine methyltransferase [Tumebacillus algifaecis]
MKIGYDTVSTPFGEIFVALDEAGVRKVALSEADWAAFCAEWGTVTHDPQLCAQAVCQLNEYFRGERRAFDLPLSMHGTPFRKQVWAALCDIPYGEVRSYGQIAEAVGKPKAPRAIGQANRNNPLPILIPCHRVIGKTGALVGYAGPRTDIKTILLQLENALPQ